MLGEGKFALAIEEAQLHSAGGHHAEALRLAAQCIPELREEISRGGDTLVEARKLLAEALRVAGVSLFEQQDLPAAMTCFQEVVSIAAELQDMRTVGFALHEMAYVATRWQNFPQAVELSKGAIRANALANCEPLAPMQGLAVADQLIGNFDEAEAVLRLARESCEARGDLIHLGQALHELGMAAAGRERWNDAIDCLVKAMRVKRISGDVRGLENSRQILSQVVSRNPAAGRQELLKNDLESM